MATRSPRDLPSTGTPDSTAEKRDGRGWAPLFILPIGALVFTPLEWPRWLFMWLLAFALFAGCKWLTWRRTLIAGIPWWRHAAYLFAWPGMDAKAFLSGTKSIPPCKSAVGEWAWGVLDVLVGSALFWGACRVIPDGDDMLLGWIGMVGLVFLLHFGLFQLLSCTWRAAGIDARPLMNCPISAVSVSEFWGRRWNTAFRDLTYRFLFRPLTSTLGPRWAIAAGFVFSGLVHELVISIPAGGGYGFPTLFFGIQGAALLGERSRWGHAIGLGIGWRGWFFILLVVAGPAYGLFHPPFVRGVIVPFMKAVRAA